MYKSSQTTKRFGDKVERHRQVPQYTTNSNSSPRHLILSSFAHTIMVTYGLGSSTSPIIIDDSDDESADARLVAQQLQPTSTATSPSPPGSARLIEVPSSETNDDEHILVSDDSPEELAETIKEGKGYNILLRMGYRPGQCLFLSSRRSSWTILPGQGLGPHLEGTYPLVLLVCITKYL